MNDAIDPVKATKVLMEALSSTFADIGFIDVEAAPGGKAELGRKLEPGAPVRVAIDALKPISCRIELDCSLALKKRIETTLFQGENVEEEDSLLEILNVVAGSFLTSYFGPGANVRLELPQYLFFSDGTEGDVLAEVAADAEGEPLRAVLRSVRYRY